MIAALLRRALAEARALPESASRSALLRWLPMIIGAAEAAERSG